MKKYNRKQFLAASFAAVAAYSIAEHFNIFTAIKKYLNKHADSNENNGSRKFSKALELLEHEYNYLCKYIDCVITDDSWRIICLRYRRDIMEAPCICLKIYPQGEDDVGQVVNEYVAIRLIKAARNNNIEIYKKPEVISMLRSYDEEDEIPEEAYYEVSWIYSDLIKRGKFQWDGNNRIELKIINFYET